MPKFVYAGEEGFLLGIMLVRLVVPAALLLPNQESPLLVICLCPSAKIFVSLGIVGGDMVCSSR
jgi:hypothetical protein